MSEIAQDDNSYYYPAIKKPRNIFVLTKKRIGEMRATHFKIVLFLLISSSFCFGTEYQIIDLGKQSSFFSDVWRPLSINDNGQLSGTEPQGLLEYNAFVWENKLKSYVPANGGNVTWANNIGQAVLIVGAEYNGFSAKPFCWKGGLNTYLATLPAKSYGEAMAANAEGTVVGYVAGITSTWLSTAVIWQGNEPLELAKLNPDDTYNMATDINIKGQIVGYSGNSNVKRAFLEHNGQMRDLGTLPGDISAVPEAINDESKVVGYSLNTGNEKHAFIWDNQIISPLPGDGDQSWATGLNDKGQVVGTIFISSQQQTKAVIWVNKKMSDLNTQLPQGNKWILQQADDINNSGWIVGVGTNPEGNENHGFLLIPLEQETITATIDIKPETLNLKSKGNWVTCYIWLPEDYNVSDVDTQSIFLGSEIPAGETSTT